MFVSRSRFALALSALLLSSTSLHAQSAAPAQPLAAFKPMAFLVGHCWKGNFPGSTNTDEHCFEWVYGGKFIRDRHVVRGGPPYQGETIYTADPKTGSVSYWYISSDGMVVTGGMQETPDGLVFPSKYATATGDVELKAIWKPTSATTYSVTSQQRTATGWKPMWTMDMTRQPQ
jgi:hypothetical protein